MDDRNFLFLRYEDMSRDELSTANRVYDFIQRPITRKLLKWIDESSKVHGTAGGAYSTVRNSTLTMTAWRHKITFTEVCLHFKPVGFIFHGIIFHGVIFQVNKIQREPNCKQFMKRVGYISLSDAKAMDSDDIPVFNEWRNSINATTAENTV